MIKLKLLFWGALTDVVGQQQLNSTADAGTDVAKLDANLKLQHPSLSNYKYKIAVNQQLVSDNQPLNDGDEIAFLPPFAGG